MTAWLYDDPSIENSDRLFRRVPKVPGCLTYDPATETYVISPGGLRRDANEGMSTHLESIIDSCERDAQTLYPSEKYSSILFVVEAPRSVGAGVLPTPALEEPDEDLRLAHTEVRPPKPEKDKAFWNTVVNVIADSSEWVQAPGHNVPKQT